MLCENRFQLPGSPSTCALDAGIVPFPSIALLLVVLVFLLSQLYSKSNLYGLVDGPPTKVLPKWVHSIYIVLVVCLFAMRILEIARLVAAHLGVGLLPFGVIADVLVLGMLCYGKRMDLGLGRSRCVRVSFMLVFYWFISIILEAIKVARLTTLEGLHQAKGTAYPTSDWLLDNAVILGLFVVFLLIEGVHLVIIYKKSFLTEPPHPSGAPEGKPLATFPKSFSNVSLA